MTGSPLLNFQPFLTLMVKVRESLVVMLSASAFSALPVLGSYCFSPRKIMPSTLPPSTSLVLAGSSGFCGSPQTALRTASPLPPPSDPPPPPQAVRVRAAAAARAGQVA